MDDEGVCHHLPCHCPFHRLFHHFFSCHLFFCHLLSPITFSPVTLSSVIFSPVTVPTRHHLSCHHLFRHRSSRHQPTVSPVTVSRVTVPPVTLPWQMKEAGDSPGCTRAVRKTTFFSFPGFRWTGGGTETQVRAIIYGSMRYMVQPERSGKVTCRKPNTEAGKTPRKGRVSFLWRTKGQNLSINNSNFRSLNYGLWQDIDCAMARSRSKSRINSICFILKGMTKETYYTVKRPLKVANAE